MGDKTSIEWTRSDDGTPGATWNPIVGCSRVSPGCDHCYAIGRVHRKMSAQHVGLTVKPEGERVDWNGKINVVEHLLEQPLRWRRPRRVFVNSLSDLFHPEVTDWTIAHLLAVMALAPQHTFQVLTKRPQRMAEDFFADPGNLALTCEIADDLFTTVLTPHQKAVAAASGGWWAGGIEAGWPIPNVWIGTSIESDRYAFRARYLRNTPAAVRFISAEPLLGPLPSLDLTGIDWLIVGGESGPGSRPMHPDWVRDLRDRCERGFHPLYREGEHPHCTEGCAGECHPANRLPGPAFFFKQWGDWAPIARGMGIAPSNEGREVLVGKKDAVGAQTVLRRVGKKDAGRVLDGRTWDEFPQVAAVSS